MTAAHYAGLSRIPLAFVAAFLILHVPTGGRSIAAGIVLLAGLTDMLDGMLARRQRTVSAFGAVLDFTTDKAFTIPTLFLAVAYDPAGLWLAILITVREMVVMGVRTYTAAAGAIVAVSPLGKLKSFLLYGAIGFLLLDIRGAIMLLALATFAAVLSGVEYLYRAWPHLEAPLLRSRTAPEPAVVEMPLTDA